VVAYKNKNKTNKVEVVICFAGEMIFIGNNKTATMEASHTIILLKAPKENTLFSSGLSCKKSSSTLQSGDINHGGYYLRSSHNRRKR
jgi:hypothetical protein